MGVSKHDRLLKNEKIFVANLPADALLQARKAQLEGYGLCVRIH
jgi:hypothetical protein